MNIDNSNKSQHGSKSKSSLKTQLEFLKSRNLIVSYQSKKYGYHEKRQDQFKCDYLIKLPQGEEWILYSAASLTTDRLKTKQWDAFNIKKINPNICRAFVVCPENSKTEKNIERYREYIRSKKDISFIDDILFHNEFIQLIQDHSRSTPLAGSKAANNGFDFEKLLVCILSDKQNLSVWKGKHIDVGVQYNVFKTIMNKLELQPENVTSIEAKSNVPRLPKYVYSDGKTKRGGSPKTDIFINVEFTDKSLHCFTFSCKSTTKPQVTAFQFQPKHCVDLLRIKDKDVKQLLEYFVSVGGKDNLTAEKANSLTQKLKPYVNEFNHWVLRGSDKECSSNIQMADYIITHKRKNGTNSNIDIQIETIDECIERQYALGYGDFGTAFSWTVTSTKGGRRFPQMKLHI